MSNYLADLTIRLADGMGRLPPSARQRHGGFLLSRQQPDGGFAGREGGSDLYYTSFALRGLAILGELHGEVAAKAGVFLRRRLSGQAAIIDFLSLLYGAMLLENAAGVDVFSGAAPAWRENVAAALESFRRDDGGYARSPEGQAGSTYYSFLVLLCRQLIGGEIPQPERLVEFLRGRQRQDGGFVDMALMKTSGTNPTAAAIGALQVLGALDNSAREGAIDYLLDRQTDEGGLAANTRIPFADVLSTFTGLWTLTVLGAAHELDLPRLRGFVESCEIPDGGFVAGLVNQVADAEYTFYGLGALALA
jgi:geranylgeranyl transferase type-2 subunit beta